MKRVLAIAVTLLVPVTLTFGACGDSGGNGGGGSDGNGNGSGTDTGVSDVGEDTGMTNGGEDTQTNGDDTSEEGCDLAAPIAISGTLATHPVTNAEAVDGEATVENSRLGMYAALGIIQSQDGIESNPLPLGTESGPCAEAVSTFDSAETSSPFTLDAVDVDDVVTGLVGVADDSSDGDDTFATTATGLAAADALGEDVSDVSAFVVSNATVDKIAEISGQSRDDLMSAGIMLGLFVDEQGQPVEGVKVGKVEQQEVSPLDSAIYPNADYTDASTGSDDGSTSANGVFVVPDQGSLTTFGGTQEAPSVDTSTQQGATTPGVVFTLVLTVESGS